MNTALVLLKDNVLNVIIVGLFLSVWASWKIARWSKGVDASIRHTEQNIERLTENIQNLPNSLSRLDSRVDALSNRIDTLSQKVDTLYHMFVIFLGHRVERTTSPRTLTDYGANLSRQIDAPSLAAHYTLSLRGKIGSMNAWQIQELCFSHAEHEIMIDLQQHDMDRYNQITMCAYREGIDLSQTMRVVGIVMRDQLLQQTGQLPRVQIAPGLPWRRFRPLEYRIPDRTDRKFQKPGQRFSTAP